MAVSGYRDCEIGLGRFVLSSLSVIDCAGL